MVADDIKGVVKHDECFIAYCIDAVHNDNDDYVIKDNGVSVDVVTEGIVTDKDCDDVIVNNKNDFAIDEDDDDEEEENDHHDD